jgi:hypothetical protein
MSTLMLVLALSAPPWHAMCMSCARCCWSRKMQKLRKKFGGVQLCLVALQKAAFQGAGGMALCRNTAVFQGLLHCQLKPPLAKLGHISEQLAAMHLGFQESKRQHLISAPILVLLSHPRPIISCSLFILLIMFVSAQPPIRGCNKFGEGSA